MSDIQVIIFPDQYTEFAIKTDAGLVNISKVMSEAGFFKRRELKKIAQKFVEVKTALITNPGHSLIISADLVDKINQYAMSGEVLTVTGFNSGNDGLFDLDGGVSPHED